MKMGGSSKYPSIIKYMMLEEIRMQAAMIGKFQFIFFSVFIAIFAFILSVLSPLILESTSMREVYFLIHIIVVAYGMGVGAFGLFADQIMERRFGEVNFLLTTPTTQPISFRSVFLAFYVKDVIYYLLISIIPLIAGIVLSIPFTSFQLTSVLFLGLTITFSFLLGISFSFFMSSLYVRWKIAGGVVAAAVAIAVVGSYLTSWYNLEQILPTLMFQYSGNPLYLGFALVLILLFSAFAVRFIKVEFGRKTFRFKPDVAPTVEKFSFTKRYSKLMAKEWLDIKRSETLYPIMGAYIGPLIFLWFTLWFLRNVLVLPIHFNIVFYSGMIGLFSVTIYSWLNNTDAPDFYQVLPVTVPRLIRTKMLMFVLLTYAMSAVFLVILSVLNSELHLLWLGLLVAFITITYTLTATAYLTGLRTNVYLFDVRVLGKFSLMVIPPLVMTIIASFMLSGDFILSVSIIGVVCILLILSALLLYRGIDKRWKKESFVI
jgi:MFS family permease